jgi:cytochrome c
MMLSFVLRPMLVGASLAAGVPAVHALDVARANELARQRGCMACHAVDRRMVGPAYRDVAQRYTGQADAATQVAQRIQRGSSGVWGPVPMPPTAGLSDNDALLLAQWALAGAPRP